MHLGHVRLRGHHLVCTHFYRGADFPGEFSRNLERVMTDFEHKGAIVEAGPDDLCVHCGRLTENGECKLEGGGESSIRGLDALALTLLQVGVRDHVTYETILDRIPNILVRWKQFACHDCDLCNTCRNSQGLMARGA